MESDEREARLKGLNIRDAIVFLVDFRTPMLKKDASIDIAEDICPIKESSSLLSITLRCIADVMKSKIVGRSPDAVAVIAFGARGPVARQGWPGVRIIRPLKQCDAAAVKLLQRIAQRLEAGDADALLDMDAREVVDLPLEESDPHFCFGPGGPVEFDKALWAVRHQFTTVTASRYSVLHRKRIFVFTNDEDPSRGSAAVKNLSVRQAKDLADLGAMLDVSILASPNQLGESAPSLDVSETSKFFNDLVYTDEDVTNENIGSVMLATVYSFEELRTRVRRKEMTKRALRKTVLHLAGDYRVGVALYGLVRKATRPQKVELVASTNKPAFKITTNTCERVGEILKPSGIRHMFTPDYLKTTKYRTPGAPQRDDDDAAEKEDKPDTLVYGFTKAETVKAKALGKEGLTVYCFRKKGVLREEYNLGPATFVFPDDTQFIGSTKAFVSLHKSMLKRGVIGIVAVRLSATSSTGVRFAALVPQEEEFTGNDEQIVPGGFQLHYLPYKDDIYTLWRKEMTSVRTPAKQEPAVKEEDMEVGELNQEPESVSVARNMVRKLKIRRGQYSPHVFLNPDLQRFYAGLENAAGVETSFNPQDDMLNPDVDKMQSKAGHLAAELKRLDAGVDFDGDEEAERFGTKGKKRSAEQSEAALKKEEKAKANKELAIQTCDVPMYISMYQAGTLEKLRKPDLQLYCRAHGLHDKGTKKNLLIVIEDHIGDRLRDGER